MYDVCLRFLSVPKDQINNIPALVQIMAWRRAGDKPLSEPMMLRLPTHICVTRPQFTILTKSPSWSSLLPIVLRTRRGAKRTDVTIAMAIENTWRRPNQHCKFNAIVARIDDHSIVFNYAVWARCHHTVLNWPAILSERFVWCLKMTFDMRYRWKRGAHARAARRRVGCTQSHKISHKINFCVNIAVSR